MVRKNGVTHLLPFQKPAGCDDLYGVKRVEGKQVLITGDDGFCLTIDGELEELVILWVTASLNVSDNGHSVDNSTQKPEKVFSILQGNISVKFRA